MDQKNSSVKSGVGFILLAMVGLVLIFAIISFWGPARSSLLPTQGSTPGMTSSPYPAPEDAHTATVTLTPNLEATQRVAAIDNFLAKLAQATYPVTTRMPATPVFLPTGIYDDQRVKVSAGLVFIDAQNAYGGFIDGNSFGLYAGALQSDPEQGVLHLSVHYPFRITHEQFDTPTKHGAIRVVSEQNNRFTLIAEDETVFYFDLPARRFVASMTEFAPSVTPAPPDTPSPTIPPGPTRGSYPPAPAQGTATAAP